VPLAARVLPQPVAKAIPQPVKLVRRDLPSGPSSPERIPGPADSPRSVRYDPAFESAVRDGCMTIQQAIERGDRSALAQTIASRHGLPMDLAELAVDNRITIRQAVMQKLSREAAHPQASSGIPRGAVFAVLGLLLLVMGVGIGLLQRAPAPEGGTGNPTDGGATPARFSAEEEPLDERSDAAGRIVGSGIRSEERLIAFCESGPGRARSRWTSSNRFLPAQPGGSVSLARRRRRSADPPVRIRDPTTSRWVAETVGGPIPTEG
jgi:hypothetical protein